MRPQCVEKASSRLPWRGKRSAVAVVNDSPVDCQSRDRAARRRLSAKLTEGWTAGYWEMSVISAIFKTFSSHPSDPAAPGHLPSEGRPGVLRLSAAPLWQEKSGSSLAEILQNAGGNRLRCKCNGPLRHDGSFSIGNLPKSETFAPDGRTGKGRNFPDVFDHLPWDICLKIANCMISTKAGKNGSNPQMD